WSPAERLLVVNDAVPQLGVDDVSGTALASAVVPSEKLTVPGGLAMPLRAHTVAVNVTVWPKTEGSGVAVTVVAVWAVTVVDSLAALQALAGGAVLLGSPL